MTHKVCVQYRSWIRLPINTYKGDSDTLRAPTNSTYIVLTPAQLESEESKSDGFDKLRRVVCHQKHCFNENPGAKLLAPSSQESVGPISNYLAFIVFPYQNVRRQYPTRHRRWALRHKHQPNILLPHCPSKSDVIIPQRVILLIISTRYIKEPPSFRLQISVFGYICCLIIIP